MLSNIGRMTTTPPRPLDSDFDADGFAVIWSGDDGEYVGLAKRFPSMSWLAATRKEALTGIRERAWEAALELDLANGGWLETEPIYSNGEMVGLKPIRWRDLPPGEDRALPVPVRFDPANGLTNAEILAELRDDR